MCNVVCACAALPLHRSAERWRWRSCVGVRRFVSLSVAVTAVSVESFSPSLCTIIHWLARKNVFYLSESSIIIPFTFQVERTPTCVCTDSIHLTVCVCVDTTSCVCYWSIPRVCRVIVSRCVCLRVCDVCVNGEEESESVWNGAMIGWTPFWKRRKKENVWDVRIRNAPPATNLGRNVCRTNVRRRWPHPGCRPARSLSFPAGFCWSAAAASLNRHEVLYLVVVYCLTGFRVLGHHFSLKWKLQRNLSNVFWSIEGHDGCWNAKILSLSPPLIWSL